MLLGMEEINLLFFVTMPFCRVIFFVRDSVKKDNLLIIDGLGESLYIWSILTSRALISSACFYVTVSTGGGVGGSTPVPSIQDENEKEQ